MARLAQLGARQPGARAGIGIMLFALAMAPVARHAPAAEGAQVVRTWYPDGQLASEREFRHGKESGEHRGWWPGGRLKFSYSYRNGLLEGTSREWFSSGTLYREQRYDAGHETGLQRLYWEDGRVRASYEVRDGRRFGLMGSKGCVTKDTLADGAP